jgi:hypothetical protein
MFHEAWTDQNYASPGTTVQFGPFTTAGGISRLVRIRSVFSTSQPGLDLGPNATIRDQICWGVQFGAVGYTPLVLPADVGGANFFWSEMLGGNTVASAAWTPPTNDFGWADTRVATREWRGQEAVGESADFYVTAGVITIGASDFAASMSLEVDYSTP